MVEDKFLAKLKNALDYNPETGEFHWKVALNCKIRVGTLAGCIHKQTGRLYVRFQGNLYFAHHLAWLFTHGGWPDKVIDHVDGNPLNNRISNLRDVSQSVNQQNQRNARSDNRTGFLGVSWNKTAGKFRASIWIDGKQKHLGYFMTPEEAHAAYLAAKRILHEGCTI